jgi:hypothetical protein
MGEAGMNQMLLAANVLNVLVAGAVTIAGLVAAILVRKVQGASRGGWVLFGSLLLMGFVILLQAVLWFFQVEAGPAPWTLWIGRLLALANLVLIVGMGAGIFLLRPVKEAPHA